MDNEQLIKHRATRWVWFGFVGGKPVGIHKESNAEYGTERASRTRESEKEKEYFLNDVHIAFEFLFHQTTSSRFHFLAADITEIVASAFTIAP